MQLWFTTHRGLTEAKFLRSQKSESLQCDSAAGLLALAFAAIKSGWVNKQDAGNDTMKTIANNIQEGAMAFLSAEYKKLSIFVVVVAALLAYNSTQADSNALIALSFVVGAICSGLAGFVCGLRRLQRPHDQCCS